MQSSFSDVEYAAKKKRTRRERFLDAIEAVTPWAALVAEIEPFYAKGEGRGRPPIGLERMQRTCVAQKCFGLSDDGIENTVYDNQSNRRFVGIDLARDAAPNATTLLKFRRLLETQGLTRTIFETINAHLAQKGLMMRRRHDRRCDVYCCAALDQEPQSRPRPAAAPGQERPGNGTSA